MLNRRQITAALTAATVGVAVLALPPAAHAEPAPEGVRINEVVSTNGDPGDWVEFFNSGPTAVDLSGFVFQDNSEKNPYAFPAGSVIEADGYLVIDEYDEKSGAGNFDFGLGGDDSARLFDPSGGLVDSFSWTQHAPTSYGVDAEGSWGETSVTTKGAENVFASVPEPTSALRLNEVDSQPADWVELVNIGDAAIDLEGYELRDNSDDHSWRFPAGATIEPGAFLVVDEQSEGLVDGAPAQFNSAIGIGSADRIRLFSPEGALLDDTLPWDGHATIGGDAALATLARCPDGEGDFVLAHPTPGAGNSCASDPGEDPDEEHPLETAPWPGLAATRVIDDAPMFLEDSSGLDTQATPEGVFLWAVDNGEGRFWKLRVNADGSAGLAEGWESGKRARFQRDASDPGAKGPDTEGITVAEDGFVYLASERDNGAKGVNENTVLKVDPNAPGPDVVATQEWDLTALLPQVSANLGMEAIEWVADADLVGKLFDANTGAPYDPAGYPGHGDGLFFVAVEDGGQVFAFALNADGSATAIAELQPRLAGVMALDWDTALGGLWAVCDDGCDGASAFLTLNGSDTPDLVHYARPAELPNTNNEGFATAPAELVSAATPDSAEGLRPAWWFTDGASSGALRSGALFAADDGGTDPDGGSEDPDGSDPDGSGSGGSSPDGSGSNGSSGEIADTGAADGMPFMLGAAFAALLGAAALAFGLRVRSRR